jgi:hypothetical protein
VNDVRNHSWSFRPGDWFGIFGARAVVVLPPTEKARVAGIWELVDDGAGFDETLDALISSGLRELPGFVLVSDEGGETKVVIRGAAHAHFATADDVVHVQGDQATTWVERTLTDVTRIRIEVGDGTGDGVDGLAIDAGLVRLAAAEYPAVTAPAAPVEAPSAAVPPVEPAPAPVVEPDPEPVVEPDPEPVVEPEPAPEIPGFLDELLEHDTRTGDLDPGQFVRQPPGIPGQPPAPSVTAHPVARLVFSSGDTVDVDRAVLIGRAPEARRFASDEQPRLVTVPSPQQEISSTHLEVRPGSGADHGSAVVTDVGSTNGTLLIQPGLPPESLKVGIAVQLIPGAVIDLGDGVTIQVVNP